MDRDLEQDSDLDQDTVAEPSSSDSGPAPWHSRRIRLEFLPRWVPTPYPYQNSLRSYFLSLWDSTPAFTVVACASSGLEDPQLAIFPNSSSTATKERNGMIFLALSYLGLITDRAQKCQRKLSRCRVLLTHSCTQCFFYRVYDPIGCGFGVASPRTRSRSYGSLTFHIP